MKFWFWATVVFVVGFGVAAWLMHVYTNAELANYIALVAAGVACAQSARQATAAANETLIDRAPAPIQSPSETTDWPRLGLLKTVVPQLVSADNSDYANRSTPYSLLCCCPTCSGMSGVARHLGPA